MERRPPRKRPLSLSPATGIVGRVPLQQRQKRHYKGREAAPPSLSRQASVDRSASGDSELPRPSHFVRKRGKEGKRSKDRRQEEARAREAAGGSQDWATDTGAYGGAALLSTSQLFAEDDTKQGWTGQEQVGGGGGEAGLAGTDVAEKDALRSIADLGAWPDSTPPGWIHEQERTEWAGRGIEKEREKGVQEEGSKENPIDLDTSPSEYGDFGWVFNSSAGWEKDPKNTA